jgi:hypothetical protein
MLRQIRSCGRCAYFKTYTYIKLSDIRKLRNRMQISAQRAFTRLMDELRLTAIGRVSAL